MNQDNLQRNKRQAEAYLRLALQNQHAQFRDGQWQSIAALLNNQRVLVVQRTGWGKSMVYFLAAKLLREQRRGPTIIISPLLSLMRNQIAAAKRIGIVSATINSTNEFDWEQISNDLINNEIDIIFISPERLANEYFNQNVLAAIVGNIGMLVIDEAHCISDWGHDFRPDYRRIVRVLKSIPSNVPILATTATANDRVVHDIKCQLGDNIIVQRGSLVRTSLQLQNIKMPSQMLRMAWLAELIPNLAGSGIVYTLTQRDADQLTKWLCINNIVAKAYHADVDDNNSFISLRESLEQELLNNDIKVLVATVALGLGFDKPDLGFVIHFQRPASVVHYYQQVGRAGRALDEAFGILLCGEEDDDIANYFIDSAFPPQRHIDAILQVLSTADGGLTIKEMQQYINIKQGQIEKTIKFLNVESPSPIVKIGSRWHLAASAENYIVDLDYINAITSIRKAEQQEMREYMQHSGCLMRFLQDALDDESAGNCGKCANCNPTMRFAIECSETLINNAGHFLRHNYKIIAARKQWPRSNAFSNYSFRGLSIDDSLRASEGRALCNWRDAGWGELVMSGKYNDNKFSNELVVACVEMLAKWAPAPAPQWVACIPSLRHPNLVPDFARALAQALKLPFIECVSQVQTNEQQKNMRNSQQQAKNLDGVFELIWSEKCSLPCLLIDDVVDSRWTITVVTALLRQRGCQAVYPLALAMN